MQLSQLRMQADETVAGFFARTMLLRDELTSAGCPPSDHSLMLAVLNAMPPEFKIAIQLLRYQLTVGNADLDVVKKVLLQSEADYLQEQSTQSSQSTQSASTLWSSSFTYSRGHLVPKNMTDEEFLDFYARMPRWVIDSGANRHIMPWRSCLTDYHAFDPPIQLQLGGTGSSIDVVAFYRRKPNLSALRVFGATAWVYVTQPNRNKLQPKAVKGIFLGYAVGSKAYKLWVNGRLVISKDVQIDETAVLDHHRSMQLPVQSPVPSVPAPAPAPPPAAFAAATAAVSAANAAATAATASAAVPKQSLPQQTQRKSCWGGGKQQHQLFRCYRQIRQPELGSMTVSDTSSSDTPTVLEALSGPHAEYWREAMHTELASLHANGTWTLVERPPGARVLPTKWVLKIKRDATGAIEKFKARLVAKGFMQVSGVDVGDVYAPVSKHTTLRALLALAAARDMEVHQIDVEAAFLNGMLQPDEVIHVQQPEGFEEGSPNTVCRLQKALYGLRQAPRAWHAKLKQELEGMGFCASESDPALFMLSRPAGTVYLLVYVDDCLLCTEKGDLESLDYVKQRLSSVFGIKDLGQTRPDIAYAVGALARHLAAPTQQHWAAAKAVLSYLKGTASQGLVFGGSDSLQGYCDADYAGDKDTARSTTGYVFTLHGAAISWSSRLQPTVAMSTAEAEYMAASGAVKEAVWLRKLMQDLGLPGTCVNIMCDNQAALQLLNNPMASARSKHISVHHHFARERAVRGEVMFTYCSTSEMVADVMTKPLAAVKLGYAKEGCGISSM
ncbi:hypothetical protein QJQ45_022193 [Haematococcus lacustris]|nr:hypothetical protein QJQ45_022193 [Haematococcus lacustris]